MGYDLSGGFNVHIEDWPYALDLARLFGWNQRGTLAPDDVFYDKDGNISGRFTNPPEEWGGDYLSNDDQWVDGPDALGLSQALSRALAGYKFESDDQRAMVEDLARYVADRFGKGGFGIR
jgi:hypothetical protein